MKGSTMQGRKLAQAEFTFAAAAFAFTIVLFAPSPLRGQLPDGKADERITEHLSAGEFSLAVEIAKSLPADQAEQQFARIATAQIQGGARRSAVRLLSQISDDRLRFKTLHQPGLGAIATSVRPSPRDIADVQAQDAVNHAAAAGGVTQADFQPLINLIRTTIDPDGWNDTNGDGIILAYPAGVYVDPSGTLQRLKIDPKRNLGRLARTSSLDSGN